MNEILSAEEMAALGITESALAGLIAQADEEGDDTLRREAETALTGRRWAVELCATRLQAQ